MDSSLRHKYRNTFASQVHTLPQKDKDITEETKKQRKRERQKKRKTLPEFQHNDIILDCHTACASLFFPKPNSFPPREKPFQTTHLCYRYK